MKKSLPLYYGPAVLSIALIVLVLFMVACQPLPQESPVTIHQGPENVQGPVMSGNRFEIEMVQRFRDENAYNNYRVVYIITDTKTGVQYLGVSGIGTCTLGAHPAGKTIVQDER